MYQKTVVALDVPYRQRKLQSAQRESTRPSRLHASPSIMVGGPKCLAFIALVLFASRAILTPGSQGCVGPEAASNCSAYSSAQPPWTHQPLASQSSRMSSSPPCAPLEGELDILVYERQVSAIVLRDDDGGGTPVRLLDERAALRYAGYRVRLSCAQTD
ncbi:hypothetical protein Vretifemale_16666, partial [Volvox reticuliferus]